MTERNNLVIKIKDHFEENAESLKNWPTFIS